jgi:hypothetical protein
MHMSRIFNTSLAYAAIVFGVGFVLGSIRVFLVVPRIGARWAELLEAPLMLIASFLAARFITQKFGPFKGSQKVAIGICALVFMLLAEFSFILARGFGISEYIASRDPVSGPVYLLSLALFAAMPFIVAQRGSNQSLQADGPDGPRPELKH